MPREDTYWRNNLTTLINFEFKTAISKFDKKLTKCICFSDILVRTTIIAYTYS